MTPQQLLRERSKKFAIAIVRFCRSLPQQWEIVEIGKQLLRSGTSVAANYRACQRARSDKEFCSKMGVVVEEADESQLWLELIAEAEPSLKSPSLTTLTKEASELTAIFTASHTTAKANMTKRKAQRKKERAL